ncbi:DUF2207 domain-containing protein [Occultella glacieicola]|nr:DUF2207 domain-containing protein [Occultella glacieicola]
MPANSTIAQHARSAVGPLLGLALALVLAITALAAGAAPAHADDQGDRAITRYDVTATANPDGTIDVMLDFAFDFADTPGHGPYLTLVTRQEIADDPDHYRVLEITDVQAMSPSGAPAEVHTEDDDNGLVIRIGDESIDDVSGVQDYVVSYTVAGIPNSGVGAGGEDEIYWNVIGSAWEIPLEDISVSVVAAAPVVEADCRVGDVGSRNRCESFTVDGGSATFTQGRLEPGEGMSVILAYPPDSFGGVQPILAPRRTLSNSLGVDGPAGIVAGVAAVAGLALVAVRARRRGRDREYLGLTPGLAPTSVDDGGTGPRRKRPVAVQFTPPQGVRPGEVGTLTDEVADPHDVTATIIDLAVRGYLTIEEIPAEGKDEPDWRLIRTPDRDWTGLADFEVTLLRGFFPHSSAQETTLTALSSTFHEVMAGAQQDLYAEVVSRGWFAESPQRVRNRWIGRGIAAMVLGIFATLLLGLLLGLAVLGLPLIVVGILTLALSRSAPARTAAGTAVLAQALGFKQYLEKAEANQIRFEEGEDIFSAYLPFAIAFGVAERWAALFSELAAQGAPVPQPTWYIGPHYAVGTAFWASGFASSINSFNDIATTAIAATPASSGGSGFSSGGGFSGGGIGGGGGGGW